MANYNAKGRSNYVRFQPKKLELLEELFPDANFVSNGDGLTCVTSEWGTPSRIADPETENQLFELGVENADNVDALSLLDVVHHALEPGEVFVWVAIGAERMRYLFGVSVAIDHTGKVLNQISLDDIYQPTWTRAEY